MENGRCRLHGGLSPKGTGQGQRQLKAKPKSAQTKSDWRRAEAKLQRWAREDADRIRRLRAMTDTEFWKYVRRLGNRRHDPFKSAFQKALRDEIARRGSEPDVGQRKQATPTQPMDPELVAIEDRISVLRAELERRIAEQTPSSVFD